MPINREAGAGNFDVGYGLASAVLAVGTVAVATTGAFYHGLALVAGSTEDSIVTIYDSTAAAGSIVDKVRIPQGRDVWIDRYIPVVAMIGLCVVVTGTGASGAIFFNPKG